MRRPQSIHFTSYNRAATYQQFLPWQLDTWMLENNVTRRQMAEITKVSEGTVRRQLTAPVFQEGFYDALEKWLGQDRVNEIHAIRKHRTLGVVSSQNGLELDQDLATITCKTIAAILGPQAGLDAARSFLNA